MRDLYESHDALGLASLVRAGEVTPRELLQTALAIVDERNSAINAVVSRFDQLAIDQLDALPQGPLRGVPFVLKDLYVSMAGTQLSNGSRLWQGHRCNHDSYMVERYRRAGLVIFARTASPELGLTTSTESALFGKTKNPWAPALTAGGSSGGAAAAVAAGFVPAAHATDGGGSIRIPASCCGLFGLKPTRGRVSTGPDRGEGWAGFSIGHAITRSVRDSAALLDAVAGFVLGDPYAAPHHEGAFLAEVGRDPGRLRIALVSEPWNGAPVHQECRTAVQEAGRLCESLGHSVSEATPGIDGRLLAEVARVVVAVNTRAALQERAAELGRTAVAADVEPVTWGLAEAGSRLSATDYVKAVNSAHSIGRQLAAFFADYDLLLSPTMASPPVELGALALDNPDTSQYMTALVASIGFTQLMNVAGNPAASVPLHWSPSGVPIGVQFAAPCGDEASIFRLAAQLEQARPWFDRRPAIG